MPKTVQIRDLDDDVYAGVARPAAEAGISVPEHTVLVTTDPRLAAATGPTCWIEATEHLRR